MIRPPPTSTLFPYTTLFRSAFARAAAGGVDDVDVGPLDLEPHRAHRFGDLGLGDENLRHQDRKSTRLNSSHSSISYAVFCLKKKNMVILPGSFAYLAFISSL